MPKMFYYSIDVGKYVDSTVIVMLEKTQGKSDDDWMLTQRICREMKPEPGRPLDFMDDQLPVIERMLNNWPPVRLLIDKSGLGEGLAETLQKMYGASIVDAVQVTSGVKDMIMQSLREALRLNRIKLLNNPRQREQVVSMVREQSLTGSISYHPPAEGMHDDIAFALAMAVWGSRYQESGFSVLKSMPLPKRTGF